MQGTPLFGYVSFETSGSASPKNLTPAFSDSTSSNLPIAGRFFYSCIFGLRESSAQLLWMCTI